MSSIRTWYQSCASILAYSFQASSAILSKISLSFSRLSIWNGRVVSTPGLGRTQNVNSSMLVWSSIPLSGKSISPHRTSVCFSWQMLIFSPRPGGPSFSVWRVPLSERLFSRSRGMTLDFPNGVRSTMKKWTLWTTTCHTQTCVCKEEVGREIRVPSLR